MIQKKSWILLIIFFVLLILMVFVEKTPSITSSFRTPSPTSFLKLFPDWSSTDLVNLEIKNESGKVIVGLMRNENKIWGFSSPQDLEPDQGKIQGLVTSLVSLEIWNTLEPPSSLDQYGLFPPKYIITSQNSLGEIKVMNIGTETPTGSGYYVQLDNSSPVVISKYGIEGILQLLTPEALMLNNPVLQPTLSTQTPP
jgi:hypothetical protein